MTSRRTAVGFFGIGTVYFGMRNAETGTLPASLTRRGIAQQDIRMSKPISVYEK
jgi:hypothetical protein